MAGRLHLLLLIAAVCIGGPGCFVLDELDSGMDVMKERSAAGKDEAPPEAAPAPSAAARATERAEALRADAKDWWKKARTPASKEATGGPAAEIVTCRIGGSVRFMSKSDCLSQGGRL